MATESATSTSGASGSTSCEYYDLFCFMGWLVDELKLICLGVWESILGAIASLIELIPVPQFMQDLAEASYTFPPSMIYFIDLFQVPFGAAVITSAYAARFLLRRIPFIG